MDITYKRIDAELASEFKDYILPVVADDPDFDQYLFYAVLDEGHLVGLLAADPRKIGPEILSIALSPAYQGKGLARELLAYTLEDMVTMYDGSEGDPENYFGATILADPECASRLSGIFLACGFKPDSEGTFYEATVGDIKSNTSLQNPDIMKYVTSAGGKRQFRPVKDVPYQEILAFGNYMAKKNIIAGIVPDELEDDISILGYEGDVIKTGILFFKENNGTLQNTMLYRLKDESLPMDLIRLLTASAMAITKNYSDDTRLSFWAGDDQTKNLILKLFPKAVPTQRMITYVLPFDAEINHWMLIGAENGEVDF